MDIFFGKRIYYSHLFLKWAVFLTLILTCYFEILDWEPFTFIFQLKINSVSVNAGKKTVKSINHFQVCHISRIVKHARAVVPDIHLAIVSKWRINFIAHQSTIDIWCYYWELAFCIHTNTFPYSCDSSMLQLHAQTTKVFSFYPHSQILLPRIQSLGQGNGFRRAFRINYKVHWNMSPPWPWSPCFEPRSLPYARFHFVWVIWL